MSNLPTPAEVPAYDQAVVRLAVAALRCFGDEVTRSHAQALLEMWQHRALLSDLEVAAVLQKFPDGTIPDGVDGYEINSRSGYISGSMGSTP